jgi:SAM-dependent methyltransferase
MHEYLKKNQELWNKLTPIHERSEFYDVVGFKAGRSTLHSIELEEMGDVTGKSLLHLQCHFGLDTLSWGRRGAKVTGVDFSDEAIDYARKLGKEIGVDAEFICSDIYALPEVLKGKFDIVFTSYGVLTWLPDLNKWAEIIAHFLKPGGFFYIVEGHPFSHIFYNEADATELRVSEKYFPQNNPFKYEGGGDYASDFSHELTSFEWQHSMGDIINALISAGLKIEFLHEFPVCCYKALPFMKQDKDGWWRIDGDRLPLMFSLKATKPRR